MRAKVNLASLLSVVLLTLLNPYSPATHKTNTGIPRLINVDMFCGVGGHLLE